MNIIQKIKEIVFIKCRIIKYQWLSKCKDVNGNPKLYHPLLLEGDGSIYFGKNVQIGVKSSPNFYSHYSYFEVKYPESKVIIGNNVTINNNFSAVSFSKITIEDNVLIGVNCSMIDTDGHQLESNKRVDGIPKTEEIIISKNVFIGDNVSILKGVTIGENSVVGFGSVVTKSIPANVIAAGNPVRIIRSL